MFSGATKCAKGRHYGYYRSGEEVTKICKLLKIFIIMIDKKLNSLKL